MVRMEERPLDRSREGVTVRLVADQPSEDFKLIEHKVKLLAESDQYYVGYAADLPNTTLPTLFMKAAWHEEPFKDKDKKGETK